jgi:membrane associated rhomboid family serine protease
MRLLIANVAVFFLQLLFSPTPELLMGLVPARIPQQPWTLITYSFLHGGFGHLFFNMLGLYFFGPRLEERLGGGHFLGLYVVSAVVGGLASWPVTPHAMIVGASGAVYGVLLGFARYWPRQQIMLLIPPIPMEARTLVIVFAVISLVLGLTGSGGIAHFAHLGGFVGGWLYLKWLAGGAIQGQGAAGAEGAGAGHGPQGMGRGAPGRDASGEPRRAGSHTGQDRRSGDGEPVGGRAGVSGAVSERVDGWTKGRGVADRSPENAS